jgi:hypothetical protein
LWQNVKMQGKLREESKKAVFRVLLSEVSCSQRNTYLKDCCCVLIRKESFSAGKEKQRCF